MSEKNNLPSNETGSRDLRKRLVAVPSSNLQSLSPRTGSRRADESAGITAQFILNAMRQWWKAATPIGLILAIGAATLVYVLFEPVYMASAWIQIHENAPSLVFPHNDDRTKLSIQTQIELMRSPMVLGPVASEPEISRQSEIRKEKDPVRWLAGKIMIDSVGRSELFRVSYVSPVPANSALVVNTVVDEYFKLRGYNDAKQVQRVIELLDQEKERRSSEVTRLRENVRQLTKQATGKDPFAASEAELVIQHPLAELQSRLVTAEVEGAVLEAQVEAYETMLSEPAVEVSKWMVERAIEGDEEVQTLKKLITAKRLKLHDIGARSAQGTKSPFCERLLQEIARDEQTLEALRMELRDRVKTEMEAALINRRKEAVARMRTELGARRAMETALQDRYDRAREEMEMGSGETVELEFKRVELAQAQQVLDLITTRLLQIRVEQQAPAQVTQLSRARVPTNPVQMVPYRNMVFASLAALCLPFVAVVFWERLVRRVSDTQCLEQVLNLAVVGETPHLPARTSISLSSSSKRLGQELWLFEESIDSLRTALVLSDELRDMKVLAVTSAGNDEGKTSVAAQLAVSIARASGQATLLIDGDMRSPDIHNVFEIPLEPGLVEVLSEESALEDAIVTNWGGSVHLLPAGKLRTSPHKLVGNGAWESLLEKVPAVYRYVILDTPPVLAASEALVLAKAADATLVCTMRDVSRIVRVRKTCERLVAAGSRPVGMVLNGISTRRYEQRYGSYSYSHE